MFLKDLETFKAVVGTVRKNQRDQLNTMPGASLLEIRCLQSCKEAKMVCKTNGNTLPPYVKRGMILKNSGL